MPKPRIAFDNTLLHVIAIILVTVLFYAGTLNNHFYADDFIWLDRIRRLPSDWALIFTVENRYFTPLTYLSFFVNHRLFGLNPFWYHLHDLIFHALNGILLYLLTRRLSGSKRTACIAALLFITSAAGLITVLWPSARTDLIMVFFSLATMIAFTRRGATTMSVWPLSLYLLALCAKGTALVIPVVLFLLTSSATPLRARLKRVAPYIVINCGYVALLFLSNSLGTAKVIPAQHIVSLANLSRSLPILIVPERFLANAGTTLLLLFSVLILIAMLAVTVWCNDVPTKAGTALTIFGLIPLLFTRDYVLAGPAASAISLLSSPSNRVYLASVGSALLLAGICAKLLQHDRQLSSRIVAIMLLLLLGINYQVITAVNRIWSKGSAAVRNDLTTLEKNRAMLTDQSILLLFNFEGSSGFARAMIAAYYGVAHCDVHAFYSDYIEEFTSVDKSPLQSPSYDYDAAKVKLILDCPGNPYADVLTKSGNLLLQQILADYTKLYANPINPEKPLIRQRLDDNMAKLKTTLGYCVNIRL